MIEVSYQGVAAKCDTVEEAASLLAKLGFVEHGEAIGWAPSPGEWYSRDSDEKPSFHCATGNQVSGRSLNN